MAQATQGVLDRIFAKFQSRKGVTQQEPAEIDDPANAGKKIPNPKYKKQEEQQSDDPTSLFAGLFNENNEQTSKAPRFSLPREKITEAAGRINFMDGLPKELTDAMSQDGGMNFENIAALVNHVGRSAYGKALEHGTQLTDRYVESRSAYEAEQLPGRVRTHMAKNKSVPAGMDNPVVREHLGMISERIAGKYPEATEDEIAEMTQEYYTHMAKAINPGAFTQDENRGRIGSGEPVSDVQDFDSYLQGTKTLDQAKATPAAPAKAA